MPTTWNIDPSTSAIQLIDSDANSTNRRYSSINSLSFAYTTRVKYTAGRRGFDRSIVEIHYFAAADILQLGSSRRELCTDRLSPDASGGIPTNQNEKEKRGDTRRRRRPLSIMKHRHPKHGQQSVMDLWISRERDRSDGSPTSITDSMRYWIPNYYGGMEIMKMYYRPRLYTSTSDRLVVVSVNLFM